MGPGGIARVSLFGDKLPLAGDPTLELRLDFVTGSLFDRIGATAGERCARDQKQDRPGPHPLILGNNDLIAN